MRAADVEACVLVLPCAEEDNECVRGEPNIGGWGFLRSIGDRGRERGIDTDRDLRMIVIVEGNRYTLPGVCS